MTLTDWIVLIGTQLFIVAYGIWKSRNQSKDLKGYLLSGKDMNWFTIGISIIATQASAITFLSTPGQAFGNGMGFVQFYLGLPLAMIVLSVTAVPIFHRLKVYTAYEYLENRFDLKTRSLGAFLFLTQRGLAAGLSIYAPAIILSAVLGWDIFWLIIAIGIIVIIYTVTGGTKAVSQTQKQQMFVILVGMFLAAYFLVQMLPAEVSLGQAVDVAGAVGRMEVLNFDIDLGSRYNVFSGLLGGFFLALSYFGTDQSQVQRYLGGKSITQSRLGLLMNGIVKIPMQFLILFVGILLFAFYQFEQPPLYFNTADKDLIIQDANIAAEYQALEPTYDLAFKEKKAAIYTYIQAEEAQKSEAKAQLLAADAHYEATRLKAIAVLGQTQNETDIAKLRNSDLDYAFITFVVSHLPAGLVGLLIAVMLSAAMSSAASELNALASTAMNDIYKRSIYTKGDDKHYFKASKWLTLFWGIYAIFFAQIARELENLIQAVNILGSLFYGTILGIFLTAFYIKKVGGHAVFMAAATTQLFIIYVYFFPIIEISFLWYNLIGCLMVVFISWTLQQTLFKNKNKGSGQ
ncbi:MAG: sodium:solute symporter [Bernardetiaceae bacterium]|nr:sodium:solute symporter [Bernardetiaceae bacterium]